MKIFKKKKAGLQPPSRVQKRVEMISTPDLVTWSENALYVIGKELTGWLRDNNDDRLREADMGAEALLAITRELLKRSGHGS